MKVLRLPDAASEVGAERIPRPSPPPCTERHREGEVGEELGRKTPFRCSVFEGLCWKSEWVWKEGEKGPGLKSCIRTAPTNLTFLLRQAWFCWRWGGKGGCHAFGHRACYRLYSCTLIHVLPAPYFLPYPHLRVSKLETQRHRSKVFTEMLIPVSVFT